MLVVVADRRVRTALAALLGLAEPLQLAGSAGHPADALTFLEGMEADAVLLDPKLPDVHDGLAFAGLIRERWPGMGIVVLTWSDSLEARGLDTQADRYLPATASPTDLVEAIASAGAEHARARATRHVSPSGTHAPSGTRSRRPARTPTTLGRGSLGELP